MAKYALRSPILNGNMRETSPYGQRGKSFHRGRDFANLPINGQALYGVRNVAKGILYRMPFEAGGFGNWIYVKCDDGIGIVMAHLSNFGAAHNSIVTLNDVWGYCGNTGNSTGAHLHMECHSMVPKGAPTIGNILWGSAVNYDILPREEKPKTIEYKNVKKVVLYI